MFPTPCPKHSSFVEPVLPSSTILSNNCIVSNDSIAPTLAIVIAYGAMIFNESIVNGIDGNIDIDGKTDNPPRNVSLPETSANVLTPGNFNTLARIEQIVTAPSVGGIDLNN